MDIRGALSKLDTTNDDHWTEDGLPRTTALGLKNVSRGQITAAAPGFTRYRPVLDDQPEGALPELPPAEVTSFQMESSEFGGGAPLGAEAPPPPPAPEPDADAAKAALDAADEAVAKAQKAATAAKAAEAAAQALRDQAIARFDRERTPNEQQGVLMGYLQSVAPSKRAEVQKAQAEMAPIDKAHQRQVGFGKGRPNYPTR